MRRATIFLYGLACYAVFFGSFLYAVGFLTGVGVPKSIDSGPAGPAWIALAIDAALLTLFAVQHSVMARGWFKRAWTRIVPKDAERSTYVLASSLALIVMFWQWRPLPASVWHVSDPTARSVLWAVCALGWATVLFGTFMVNHFHLFGLEQVWARLRGTHSPEPKFQTRMLYRYVRHPLMMGFLIAFWATPEMSLGHLLFALGSTGYIVVATLAFEERDLERHIGEPYRRYRARVPAFLPRIGHGVSMDELVPPADDPLAPRRASESV